jgi:peptidoglycan-associated lipoprotein
MKRGMIALLAALSMAALVAGGCASKETVKKEEPVATTVKAEPVKAEPVKAEPVKAEPKPVTSANGAETEGAKASAAAALETIYFDFDKSDLRKDARDVLYKNAEMLLKAQPDAKVKIEGNCDERGSAEYNLALGERRAKSAMQYLVTLGVKADRVSIISYGKEKPAVDGHDEAAWAKNRRADFVIIK